MTIIFPPLEAASPEGLLAIGGTLDTETLLTAYKSGIFPWPVSHESPLTWFSPDPRGVLFIDQFHTSKSMTRFLKSTQLQVTFNQNFPDVLSHCAKTKRTHETGTWITTDIERGYIDFFKSGYAYSVEVWNQKKLVGGLYGVTIGQYISGESMFHLETNASKLALHSLITQLKRSKIDWLDTQMVTPIIESLGGQSIPRNHFVKLLNLATKIDLCRSSIFSN